jgi:hypothetical protein
MRLICNWCSSQKVGVEVDRFLTRARRFAFRGLLADSDSEVDSIGSIIADPTVSLDQPPLRFGKAYIRD